MHLGHKWEVEGFVRLVEMTKLLKAWTCRPATKVGEEIDQPELKTDPGEELEITDYYWAITVKVFCQVQGAWLKSLYSKPLLVPDKSVKMLVITSHQLLKENYLWSGSVGSRGLTTGEDWPLFWRLSIVGTAVGIEGVLFCCFLWNLK